MESNTQIISQSYLVVAFNSSWIPKHKNQTVIQVLYGGKMFFDFVAI